MAGTLTVKVIDAHDGRYSVVVTPGTKLSRFQAMLKETSAKIPDVETQVLFFKGKTITHGLAKGEDDKTLEALGFTNNCTLELRKGGGKNTVADPKMTISEGDTGCVVKLPCNHWISPDVLTAYIRYVLGIGAISVKCPYRKDPTSHPCSRELTLVEMRSLAKWTEAEAEEFELKLADNGCYNSGLQQCPKCHVFGSRQDKNNPRVSCGLCRNFDFCWYCLGEWRASGTTNCGNVGCDCKDPRLALLSKAKVVKAYGVDIYTVRACPQCGMVIIWDEQNPRCKHMKCERCSADFCMRCLSVYTGTEWPCGIYSTVCKNLAPIQTNLKGV